ncbi:hypothetical protein GH742_09190 [Legionella sp. MW5194]|uniref:hypothetical protein n=1 Tax=Legionella sp. MW5194 TaxID=2662448 RepID=UPI00193CB695|nr:hypothetical protein [Legionella sp. MW5194]QRN04031.1 hypothetical protein GH742_09190 [Legionella sp. MW5194]
MEQSELYNGLAGDVVRKYLRGSTFLTALPIILVWSVLALVIYLLQNQIDKRYLSVLQWLAVVLVSLGMTGRFALAASRGDMHAGFFSGGYSAAELLSYTGRAILYNLCWFLPALALALYLTHSDNALRLFFFLKLGIGFGWVGIGYAVLVLLSFFGPLLAAALAVYTESLREVFSREPLQWLFDARRANLACYCSQTIGGLVLFLLKFFIVIVVLQILVSAVSIRAGLYFNAALSYLPFILGPILVGRLSGALVVNDEIARAATSSPSKGPDEPEKAVHVRSAYQDLIRTIHQMTREEAEAQIRQIKNEDTTTDQLLALSYLYSQAGYPEEAIQQAKLALQQCLAEDREVEAVQLFRFFSKDKSKLGLSDLDFDKLGAHLSLQNHYQEAAWCYFSAAKQRQGEAQLLMQKNYLRMCDLIRQSGASEAAKGLYILFCRHFPESSLFEFAQSQIES